MIALVYLGGVAGTTWAMYHAGGGISPRTFVLVSLLWPGWALCALLAWLGFIPWDPKDWRI
jgi:hypothetical protein